MNEKTVKAVKVEPGMTPCVVDLSTDLDSLQKAVSIGAADQGLIEFVYLEDNVSILCNEEGYNDLLTVNPMLIQKWNYEQNHNLDPLMFTANSHKKVLWKCEKGHEWESTIANVNNGKSCPICHAEQRTSFPEYAIEFYLRKLDFDVIHSYKENGYELDIYIPSIQVAIEYDGYYWHQNTLQNDLDKNKRCQKDGIKLYRIREGLPSLNDTSIDYVVSRNTKSLSQILHDVLANITGTNIDIDVKRDSIEIEAMREFIEKENSLLLSVLLLAQDWNYQKNTSLKPEYFVANSKKRVWWICNKGHEWVASIADRNNGRGCPYCSGQKVLNGYNDIKTINPKLANDWNFKKNGSLKPENFTANSNKIV